ncbi:hypothetical protein [Alicyclobacillus macrosporangiidus]|uniref:Uncharacterized protein n=1 Tax=Alicyclobacillus macrosporangiidus TaxID=392015 RepID=A0A1I7L6I6_9BACL|nr:hypothetical protein [Alicyclobacillus macrosporangiidus]SFV05258.1 hypothetical protein SAMN05421543_12618 [Alicyclobacillus macrosporangiidus]
MDDEEILATLRACSQLLDHVLALGDTLLQHPTFCDPYADAWPAWWTLWKQRNDAFDRLQTALRDSEMWFTGSAPGCTALDASGHPLQSGTSARQSASQALSADEASSGVSAALHEVATEIEAKAQRVLAQNKALEDSLCQRMGVVQKALRHLRHAQAFEHTYKASQSRPRPAMPLIDRRG